MTSLTWMTELLYVRPQTIVGLLLRGQLRFGYVTLEDYVRVDTRFAQQNLSESVLCTLQLTYTCIYINADMRNNTLIVCTYRTCVHYRICGTPTVVYNLFTFSWPWFESGSLCNGGMLVLRILAGLMM